MSRLFLPNRKPLLLPGTAKRAIRRPDPRGMLVPQLSGAPLSGSEVDYDELDVVRSWRMYEPDAPGQVRYFCYELAQTEPGALGPARYFKAVRMIRLTRVPRYLRNTGPGGGAEAFSAMRDVLVGLREKRILFLNVIAKSPQLPLVFAYGVQATGESIEEACVAADEAYQALSVGLDGTYQQLEYKPLSLVEGEILARHQVEWNQIAMARGRPMPQGVALGSSAILDGNRTDVENTNNQLESFIRGMSDKSFMLSLVTVPLAPEDMAAAWRNISVKLSAARSDQQGQRSMNAGIALPLGTGMSMGDSTGTTHGLTGTSGIGSSDGLSASLSQGTSLSHTDGTSHTLSTTETAGVSSSVSDSHATSTSLGHSTANSHSVGTAESASRSDSASAGTSYSEGANHGVSSATQQGTSASQSVSASQTESASASQSSTATHGVSVGQSNSLTSGASMSESHGVSAGRSLSDSMTAGSSWSQSAGQGLSAGQTSTSGWGQSMGQSLSQAWNLAFGQNDGASNGSSSSQSGGLNAGLLGFGSTLGESSGTNSGSSNGSSNGMGVSQTGGGSSSSSISESLARNLGQSLNLSESAGGSLSHATTSGSSVGSSQSLTAGQSLSSSVAQSASQSQSLASSMGQSLGHSVSQGATTGVGSSQSQSTGASMGTSVGHGLSSGVGQSTGVSASLSQGQSLSQGNTLTQGVSDGRTVSAGQSQSLANGVSDGISSSDSRAVSATATSGASAAMSSQQALSDAWMVAMSRQASSTGSLGVVPNIGVAVSKATFDEAKRVVGDILEAQMRRYLDGVEGGGMLYQMFLVCPDRETLVGASTLLKSAFWGAGGGNSRLPSPFTTEIVDDPEEARRLLTHAAAFSSFQRREPVTDIIEPYVYSTFVTTGEASAMCHPPTAETIGIQAQTDSMPVLAMPADRGERDLYVGHIVNGERGRVSDARFGIDMSEITHMLIQGTTGSGKTTTMMRILEQAVRHTRTFTIAPTVANPHPVRKSVPAGVLALDWMQNMRDLAAVVPEERFQLFSVAHPELGAFRFNPLEIPHEGMDPGQWLGAQADQLAASFGLGEFGRSILAEALDELYRANRLLPHELRPQVLATDGSGMVLREGIELSPVPREQLPMSAIQTDSQGNQYANVFTHPQLSRLVGLPDVAVIISRKMEEAGTTEGGRIQGTDMRNRLQSVWRRLQYYAPGSPGWAMVAADPDLTTRECLGVRDLIDPDRGLVTVIETDGLDLENRRVVLGSVILAVYRYGLHVGKGCYDHGGKGPGTFVVLEEAHELFGDATDGEDRASATMRANLYESLFRRARATGLRLVAMTQNCGHVPAAITSMTTTVLIHRSYDEADRKRVFSLLNWSNQIGQQMREWRYLGEIPPGYCIARLDARESYLESAPVQLLVDPPALPPVSNEALRSLAERRGRSGHQLG